MANFGHDNITYRWRNEFFIGRMYHCNPLASEKFYVRLLLTAVQGPRLFALICVIYEANEALPRLIVAPLIRGNLTGIRAQGQSGDNSWDDLGAHLLWYHALPDGLESLRSGLELLR